jgi:hypothetical protein
LDREPENNKIPNKFGDVISMNNRMILQVVALFVTIMPVASAQLVEIAPVSSDRPFADQPSVWQHVDTVYQDRDLMNESTVASVWSTLHTQYVAVIFRDDSKDPENVAAMKDAALSYRESEGWRNAEHKIRTHRWWAIEFIGARTTSGRVIMGYLVGDWMFLYNYPPCGRPCEQCQGDPVWRSIPTLSSKIR